MYSGHVGKGAADMRKEMLCRGHNVANGAADGWSKQHAKKLWPRVWELEDLECSDTIIELE